MRPQAEPRRLRLPAWLTGSPTALMLLVLGIYILTMSGHTYSPDEETMLETTRAVVEKGTWAMSPSRSLVQVPGIDGRTYSQYGPGQSLAAVPWVVVGRLVGTLFPPDQQGYPLRLVLGTYNALIAAGLVGLFAAMGLALGYSRRASMFSAGALAFATFLWPHSRTFFSETLVALCLFASFYLLAISLKPPAEPPTTRRLLWLVVLSGALFALAVATKVQYAVTLPAFLLYLAWRTLRPSQYNPQSAIRNPQLSAVGFWLLGLLIGALPLLLYNLEVFGNPLCTGYGSDPAGTLKTPLYEGAFGLLLSPGKGLLWYALPLVLTLWGWGRFARRHRAEAAFVAVLALPTLALFALYSFWPGDGSWGPRYLIPVLPFLMLPVLPVVQQAVRSPGQTASGRSTTTRRVAVASVVALGFLVNALGAVVNFDTYINVVNDDATRYWFPYASPIVGHKTLLEQRASEWRLRLLPQPGTTLFKSGFSYSEGDKASGEVLPRWTTGEGVMEVRPAAGASGPLSATLRLTDHRPPEMPRASVTILLDGNPVPAQAAPVADVPISTDYTFSMENRPTTFTIRTDTWNPSEVQEGGRNEVLGIKLDSVTLKQGNSALPNELVEAMPAPPYYPQPRWYYDPGTHHPADLWPVYMAETGMGRKAMLALGLPLIVVALGLIFVGWWGLSKRD
jgi:hypothetical protein